VATAFALAVTRPQFASLGGGGFLVYCPHPKEDRPASCAVIDYREQAPARAFADMFIREGRARTDLSQNGPLASGVPGVVAGLTLAQTLYGRLPLKDILSRPIALAKDGVVFTGYAEEAAIGRWPAFNAAAKSLFGCGSGAELRPCPPGTLIRQPDLARVLKAVSKSGAEGFYEGWVAKAVVDGLSREGGILTLEDMKTYHPKVRQPLSGRFKDFEVVTMPPPSSGGAIILQLLRYAELADAAGAFAEGFGSAPMIHALAHGMALAFADRSRYFGDPDFVKVPLDALLSPDYLEKRWEATYNPERAAAIDAPGDIAPPREGRQTTAFSAIDAEGNAVSVTTTINDNFGSGFVPPGTGVMMNDEMDDFSIEPGVANLYSLIGGRANEIQPGKRPLSSMSPTIVRDSGGNVRLTLGAMGGPRIITAVFQALLYRLRFGMSIYDAAVAPRLHDQWRPPTLFLEAFGFSPETRKRLAQMGYKIQETTSAQEGHAINQMNALERFPDGRVWGAPDPRGEGAAEAE